MLIISRRVNESIHIHTRDGVIVIDVMRLERNQVRLGFDAPDRVTILRSEIDTVPAGEFTPGKTIGPVQLVRRFLSRFQSKPLR